MKASFLMAGLLFLGYTTFSQWGPLPILTLKYDVELELDHFIVSNVRDLDGTEDLYGILDCSGLRIETTPVTGFQLTQFWTKSESGANENNFRNGTRQVDKRYSLVKNLTRTQVKNLEIKIGGELYDDEGLLGSRKFRCTSCTDPGTNIIIVNGQYTSNYRFRPIRFVDMPATLSSIDALTNTGEFQKLIGDTNNYFEMRFWESGVKEDGYVRTMWLVWIKPHF